MKLRIFSLFLGMICMCLIWSGMSTAVTIISSIIWFASGIVFIFWEPKKKTDGIITIIDTDEKTTWEFSLTSDPEKIRKQKSVTFGVKDSSS